MRSLLIRLLKQGIQDYANAEHNNMEINSRRVKANGRIKVRNLSLFMVWQVQPVATIWNAIALVCIFCKSFYHICIAIQCREFQQR